MKKFFKKYGGTLVFFIVLVLYLMFFVQVIALSNTYTGKVVEQAAERARYFVQEQSKYVESQISDLRVQTENVARNVVRKHSVPEALEYLKRVRTSSVGDDYFADVLYASDGKIFNCDGEEVSDYVELNALISADNGSVSRVFQYENTVMSVGQNDGKLRRRDYGLRSQSDFVGLCRR